MKSKTAKYLIVLTIFEIIVLPTLMVLTYWAKFSIFLLPTILGLIVINYWYFNSISLLEKQKTLVKILVTTGITIGVLISAVIFYAILLFVDGFILLSIFETGILGSVFSIFNMIITLPLTLTLIILIYLLSIRLKLNMQKIWGLLGLTLLLAGILTGIGIARGFYLEVKYGNCADTTIFDFKIVSPNYGDCNSDFLSIIDTDTYFKLTETIQMSLADSGKSITFKDDLIVLDKNGEEYVLDAHVYDINKIEFKHFYINNNHYLLEKVRTTGSAGYIFYNVFKINTDRPMSLGATLDNVEYYPGTTSSELTPGFYACNEAKINKSQGVISFKIADKCPIFLRPGSKYKIALQPDIEDSNTISFPVLTVTEHNSGQQMSTFEPEVTRNTSVEIDQFYLDAIKLYQGQRVPTDDDPFISGAFGEVYPAAVLNQWGNVEVKEIINQQTEEYLELAIEFDSESDNFINHNLRIDYATTSDNNTEREADFTVDDFKCFVDRVSAPQPGGDDIVSIVCKFYPNVIGYEGQSIISYSFLYDEFHPFRVDDQQLELQRMQTQIEEFLILIDFSQVAYEIFEP